MIYVVDPTLINLLKMHNQSKKIMILYLLQISYNFIYDIHFLIISLYHHAKISSDFGVDRI